METEKTDPNRNSDKTAFANVSVLDQGHFGFTKCSLCYENVEKVAIGAKCPGCGATLVDISEQQGFGGSDF